MSTLFIASSLQPVEKDSLLYFVSVSGAVANVRTGCGGIVRNLNDQSTFINII